MSKAPSKRVLIVKTSSLGDVVMGLQVARTLKANDPMTSISWVSRRRFQPMVESSQLVDQVFTFYRTGGIRAFVGLLKELRHETFDYVLDMQGLARSGLMSFATRSPVKVGRSDAREGATLFYDRMVPLPQVQSKPHAIEILLEFCRVFGYQPVLAGKIEFTESVELDDSILSKPSGGSLVIIFPGKDREMWDWDGYLELAEGLLKRDDRVKIVLAGLVKGDVSESLSKESVDRFIDLRGETDLGQVGSLIHSADLLITNEVAPIQIGSATDTPTLGIYGPVDPKEFGSFPKNLERDEVVKAPGRQMSELSAEVVLETAMRMLSKSGS